jgi:hypothetical protein
MVAKGRLVFTGILKLKVIGLKFPQANELLWLGG